MGGICEVSRVDEWKGAAWMLCCKSKEKEKKPQSRDQHTGPHRAQVCPMLLIALQQVCSPADRKQDSREQTKQRGRHKVHDVSCKNQLTERYSELVSFPTPGTEPRAPGWRPRILITRPWRPESSHLTSIWNLFWSFWWDFLSCLQSQPLGLCLILLVPSGLVVRIPSWIINMAFFFSSTYKLNGLFRSRRASAHISSCF